MASHNDVDQQAAECVLCLRLEKVLGVDEPSDTLTPWMLCYRAMSQRIAQGEYVLALASGQAAARAFGACGDINGQTRSLAEVAIARYHLGQYATALTELAECPLPDDPTCAASLFLHVTSMNSVWTNSMRRLRPVVRDSQFSNMSKCLNAL